MTPNLDDDDAAEWSAEVFERAEIAHGNKVLREAQGTLTRRGRPPIGEAAKQQVTLRLAPKVLDHFKSTGSGWQTRLGSVLERHVEGRLQEHTRSFSRNASVEVYAMAKDEKTSKKASTASSKVLKNGNTGKVSKTAAGLALTQRPSKKK